MTSKRHAVRAGRGPVFRFSVVFAVICCGGVIAAAANMSLLDGRMMQGRYAQTGSVINSPKTQNLPKTIILMDDGLRRTYYPVRQVLPGSINDLDAADPVERFAVPQQVTETGSHIASVGELFHIGEFDDFGRRIVKMETNLGPQALIQGITEITPTWTKIESVDAEGLHFVWDMRIATNSIPRDVLGRILAKQVDPDNIDQRLKVVRLYIQSERFKDAEAELNSLLGHFKNLPADQRRLFEQTSVRLRQTYARRLLDELETRRKGGQNELVRTALKSFPAENVAGETLQAVSAQVKEFDQQEGRRKLALERFDALLKDVKNSALKFKLTKVRDEIHAELRLNTIDRMAAFLQFQADDGMTPEEKIALAVSGWLAGSDYAVRNLPTASSMYDTRNFFREYLSEPIVTRRNEILAALRSQEAFIPELTARILALMKPPLPLPEPSKQAAGLYSVTIDYLKDRAPIDYLVQLPQEYDPHRRYPVILVLHGAGNTPQRELEWWAGNVNAQGIRLGQADRFGYIVIAPYWAKEQQTSCSYSEDEHAAVLYTLRDAYRRLSIDTDRVCIGGHSMGADAAWDIALAHPDLWAGYMGISPRADKTVDFYKENAEYVPSYLVFGELDSYLWTENAVNLDWYLQRGFNATVVQMKGRGRENFSDETLRLYDWMGRQKRDPFPKKFKCRSVRLWDGSFWWVETNDPPERAVVDPDNWPPKGVVLLHTEAEVKPSNAVYVKTGSARVTVWLSPEFVDFKRPCDIFIRGVRANKVGAFIEPDAALMLEDARTRSDRLHPFWAKVDGK